MPIGLTYKLLPSNNPNHRQQFFTGLYEKFTGLYELFTGLYNS